MKYFCIMSYLCAYMACFCGNVYAQDNTFYTHKREVGTNVTKLLGNMLSITPASNSEPYALQFAYHGSKNTIRLGLNGNGQSNTSVDIVGGAPFTKIIDERTLSARVCLERHLPLSNKFQLNYGVDFLGGQENSLSTTDNFFARNLNTNIFGAGPSLRFSFKLSNRIHFQTETTLYGRYLNKYEKVELAGQAPAITNSNDWDIKLQLPAQLFINIEF